jgi:prepilin-type N-terminal cleavage/methylation domain-containing protein
MRSKRGFSLIELLFALLILTIVIMTTLAMFAERNRRLQQAGHVILAYQALANEVEVVRRVNFADLDLLDDDFETDTTLLQPLRPFKTLVRVSAGTAGTKNVALTVRWGKTEAQMTILRANTGGTNLW